MRDVVGVLLVMALALAALPASAQSFDFPPDTLPIVKDGGGLSNVDIAVELSQATASPGTTRVLISRDDGFADALASGVLQSSAPLMLVPTEGEIPPQVRGEIERLGATQAIVLGGAAAVSDGVVQQLEALGLAVERRAGPSRLETAVAVADSATPQTDTVILARAFGDPSSSDPSQPFADTLAGGGMAARNNWPILLTETEQLSGPTADYIRRSGATTVEILGGTAAISAQVEEELRGMGLTTERLAGDSRAGTAIAIAAKQGDDGADDAGRVVLVQGQTEDAWAGGFAAANHAATFDAPIVLATGDQLPPQTQEWLGRATTSFAQSGARLTCVALPAVCEQARQSLGLPPAEEIPPASQVAAYELDGGYEAETAGAPALAAVEEEGSAPNEFVADPQEGQVVRFAKGNGLRLDFDETFVTQHTYSVVMRVALDETTGYRRLLDLSDGGSDNGLYVLSGDLVFYGLAGSGYTEIMPGQFHTIALARTPGGTITGYVDGEEVLRATDPSEQSILTGSMVLFQDDRVVTGEESAGMIASFEVYDGVLSPSQIRGMSGAATP